MTQLVNIFQLVDDFNKQIIGINRTAGSVEDESEFDFMVGTILEELKELKEAHANGDFIKELDATTDLIYFAAGFFTRMGIPPHVSNQIFEAVNSCNMNKKKGIKADRDIQHENDAIKPKNWVSPEDKIMDILDSYDNED